MGSNIYIMLGTHTIQKTTMQGMVQLLLHLCTISILIFWLAHWRCFSPIALRFGPNILDTMTLNSVNISAIILHLFMIRLSDAAMNLRKFGDPRDVRFKSNMQKQRHTSATSCQPVDVQELESQRLFKAQDVSSSCSLHKPVLSNVSVNNPCSRMF